MGSVFIIIVLPITKECFTNFGNSAQVLDNNGQLLNILK